MAKRNVEVDGLQRFYRLLQEVTTRLVGAQATEIDVAVDHCLAMLGEHFQVSKSGLGQMSNSGKILPVLRAWGDRPVTDYLTTGGPNRKCLLFFAAKGH